MFIFNYYLDALIGFTIFQSKTTFFLNSYTIIGNNLDARKGRLVTDFIKVI